MYESDTKCVVILPQKGALYSVFSSRILHSSRPFLCSESECPYLESWYFCLLSSEFHVTLEYQVLHSFHHVQQNEMCSRSSELMVLQLTAKAYQEKQNSVKWIYIVKHKLSFLLSYRDYNLKFLPVTLHWSTYFHGVYGFRLICTGRLPLPFCAITGKRLIRKSQVLN